MNITELVTFLYEKTPIQAARKEATDVYIAYMKDVYNIDVTYTTENMPGDITIEPNGSWTVIEQYADTLNAFQHAYNSAKLSYDYGKNWALLLGDAKEVVTWPLEHDTKDRNRDLWNNSIAASYAETQKNNGLGFEDIARNIFLDIMGDNSSYITDLNDNETRHAVGSR